MVCQSRAPQRSPFPHALFNDPESRGDALQPAGVVLVPTSAVLVHTGAVMEPTGGVLEPKGAVCCSGPHMRCSGANWHPQALLWYVVVHTGDVLVPTAAPLEPTGVVWGPQAQKACPEGRRAFAAKAEILRGSRSAEKEVNFSRGPKAETITKSWNQAGKVSPPPHRPPPHPPAHSPSTTGFAQLGVPQLDPAPGLIGSNRFGWPQLGPAVDAGPVADFPPPPPTQFHIPQIDAHFSRRR